MREIINLNSDWDFELCGEHSTVSLPHTWNNLDGQGGSVGYLRTKGIYRKELAAVDGECIFLDIQGAGSVCEVKANGQTLALHKGGYSAFRTDITEHLRNGCKLDIAVDNSDFDDVYPSSADFTFYGGLYRDVSLIKTGSCHFAFWESSSDGVYVTPVKTDCGWQVRIRALVDGAGDGYEVSYVLKDADGNTAASAVSPSTKPHTRLSVNSPVLWQGRENPYLYTLECRIMHGDECTDSLDIPVGFREITVDADKGFFLNGKPLKLKGVARHQDREDMGNAITAAEHEQDAALICEVGANSVRLAHYQHNRYFYDLCDRLGLIVWAEVPVISRFSAKKQRNAKRQLCELIRQNYNHPCIYCWGIENEITIGGGAHGKKLLEGLQELNSIAHKLDSSRLTAAAQVTMCAVDEKVNTVTDILGYNHYFGWYMGKVQGIDEWLDAYREKLPQVPLCITEYGAEGITRYHGENPVQGDYSEDYQALFHEHYIKAINSREWLFGSYVWNMFDFGSAARNEGGVRGRNNKGLVTFDRKVKKDSFYLYKAYWSDEPFVHIAGERYVNRPVGTVKIKVYSNCDNVTLEVNGSEYSLSGEKVLELDGVELHEGANTVTAHASGCEHSIVINGVTEPDRSYSMPEGTASFVRNWFDVSDSPLPDRLSVNDRVSDILGSEDAVRLIGSVAGDIIKSPALKLLGPLKIKTLLKLAKPLGISDEMVNMASGYLQTIKK